MVFAPSVTLSVKIPSLSVAVPVELPFTVTDALATGDPFSSTTLPVMVRLFCASSCPANKTILAISMANFLMCFKIYLRKK